MDVRYAIYPPPRPEFPHLVVMMVGAHTTLVGAVATKAEATTPMRPPFCGESNLMPREIGGWRSRASQNRRPRFPKAALRRDKLEPCRRHRERGEIRCPRRAELGFFCCSALLPRVGCSMSPRLDALLPGTGAVSFVQIQNAGSTVMTAIAEARNLAVFDARMAAAVEHHACHFRWPGGRRVRRRAPGRLERARQPPQFKIVGTSTGALAAPFAFLGSEYDWALKKIYTETKPGEVIASKRFLLSAVNNDSLMDNSPSPGQSTSISTSRSSIASPKNTRRVAAARLHHQSWIRARW